MTPLALLARVLLATAVLAATACSEEPADAGAPPVSAGAESPSAAAPEPRRERAPAETAPRVRAPQAGEPEAQEKPAAAAIGEQLQQWQARRDERQRWWNDPALADAAGLTAEQKQAFDRRHAEHQAAMQASAARAQEARRAFRQALQNGDMAAARAAAEQRAEAVADQALRQQLLAVELLSSLDPTQRETLVRDHGARLLRAGAGGRAADEPLARDRERRGRGGASVNPGG